ncbi:MULTISPECIES: hypothetical protein [Pseudovibrio]|uniref:baeRF11 domain-containing protein n=1 Tax=Stappiaceae TaxID=2821832 RepID=UPI0023663F7A|nr:MULTISPECIES: hypothetical protein [Pseudovibrio]MDD7911986.1 hypothetical protein [Pseudovibrio exalbescens]MDX5595485.1 hypothetical protein [Pseudovibrio sp. SPO723]
MQYNDIPSIADIKSLAHNRHPASISLFLRTTPLTQKAQQDRVRLSNLAHDAMQQVDRGQLSKAEYADLEANLADVVEDDEFWAHQAESLAVFATPKKVRTFRLPNHLVDGFEVSDRFHLTPLMRALTFPHHAIVLVLGQNAVRVIEMTGDTPAGEVHVPRMPEDAASVARKASILGRSPKGRLHGSEGQKVHLVAYARAVDAALRPFLAGSEEPLVLVANEPLRSIFLKICSYHHILPNQPSGVAEESPNHEITAAARALVDASHEDYLRELHATYAARAGSRRATDSVSEISRKATFGAVEMLMVDMDATLHGTVDKDTGDVVLADAAGPETYDILSEIACRTLERGGRVYSVRQEDLPGSSPMAAILRVPI